MQKNLTEEHIDFRRMKRHLQIDNNDIAYITGNTPASVRHVTQPNRELPRWLRLAIYVYNEMRDTDYDEIFENKHIQEPVQPKRTNKRRGRKGTKFFQKGQV